MARKQYLVLLWAFVLSSFLWTLVQQQSLFYMTSKPSSSSDRNCSSTSATTPSSLPTPLPSLNSLKNSPKCHELFQTGSMLRANQWATPACKSRTYTWTELRTCLRQRNSTHSIALIGDSRVRQLKYWFVNYLENTSIPSMSRPEHTNTVNDQPLLNLRIQFFWQSYIDQTVTDIVNNWIHSGGTDIPDLVVIGIGTWYVKLESDDFPRAEAVISQYKDALRRFALLIKELDKLIPVIWIKQGPVDMFRFRGTPQLRSIVEYNDVTEQIFNETGITTLWRSAYTISMELFSQSGDAMHYSDNVTEALVNILWNFYCNSKLHASPDDCCSALPSQ